MKLIVVSPPDYFDGEAALFNQFFAEGLSLLHLRKPVKNQAKFRSLLMNIDSSFYPRISIHQYHDLADEFLIKRLHFTEEHRKTVSAGEWNQLRANGFKLSSSIHDISTLQGLNDLDYVFFGPVFDSISKDGYNSVLADDFKLQPHQTPVFGIGGVCENNLKKMRDMNFDGAAVLGSLWLRDTSALSELKKIMKRLNDINNGD